MRKSNVFRGRNNPKNRSASWLSRMFAHDETPHHANRALLVTVALLIIAGLLMLSSATSVIAFDQTGDSYAYVKQQISHGLLPGLILMFIAARINFKTYEKFSLFFIVFTLCALVLVFIPGLGAVRNSARSWIHLGSITVQTSEIAKLSFILGISGWLASRNQFIKSLKKTTLPFIVILLLISVLIIFQPDFGTLIIFLAVAFTIFFAANANLGHISALAVIGAIPLAFMILSAPHRLQRLLTFWNPEADIQGSGYQIYQALLAIGSGSWFGVGMGQSRQKFAYVPEISSDSIFAIIGEELGFVFTSIILALFAILFYQCVKIIKRAPNTFSSLVATGITFLIVYQVLINIGAMLGLLPLTGIPLPFISLGGTNLAVLLTSIGILLNISKYSRTSDA